MCQIRRVFLLEIAVTRGGVKPNRASAPTVRDRGQNSYQILTTVLRSILLRRLSLVMVSTEVLDYPRFNILTLSALSCHVGFDSVDFFLFTAASLPALAFNSLCCKVLAEGDSYQAGFNPIKFCKARHYTGKYSDQIYWLIS